MEMHDKNITILHDWGPQVEIEFFYRGDWHALFAPTISSFFHHLE